MSTLQALYPLGALVPHGEDGHPGVLVDLLDARVAPGSPAHHAEIGRVGCVLHLNAACGLPSESAGFVFGHLGLIEIYLRAGSRMPFSSSTLAVGIAWHSSQSGIELWLEVLVYFFFTP